MKLTALLIPSLALAQFASAQPAAKPHPATHAAPAANSKAACVKLPDLSPKIPALPAGAGCAKALYTLKADPAVKIAYVSPLEGNALSEVLGLESTSFTLAYIDTKVGTGELAAPHKWYSIQYTGYLVDGTKFDSSLDKPDHEPFSFPYGAHQVVAGWDTGFAGMRVGGKRRLFIPFQLAYGPSAHGPIPAKSMLIFDLEFISQSDAAPTPKTPPAPPAAATPPASATPPAVTGSAPAKQTVPTPPATQPATPPDSTAPKPQ